MRRVGLGACALHSVPRCLGGGKIRRFSVSLCLCGCSFRGVTAL